MQTPSTDVTQRDPTAVSLTHYCVMGDVMIDDSAAIASGVVLQAASGSRITVGKGVCLSAGVCIHSRGGVLTIAAGVSLGANVLVVGSGSVGENACVSPGTTLINPMLAADMIVPPNSLIDGRASKAPADTAAPATSFVSPPLVNQSSYQPTNQSSYQSAHSSSYPPTHQPSYQPGYQESNGASSNGVQSDYSYPGNSPAQNGTNHSSPALSVRSSYDRVYGREQVSQLISTLFPHRQPLE